MNVAFVGLGAMGRGMAGNLLKSQHRVTGFDVAAQALDWLEGQGGARAGSVAEACADAEALVVMVVDAAQLDAVMAEAGPALPKGALVISGVTVPPADAQRIGAAAEALGLAYLDCPVSGGAVGAEAGALTMMAAGSDAAWSAAQPLLEAMGGNVWRLGDAPGAGSTMKMVHQLAAGCNLAVAAEVMSFGAHLGLDPAQVLSVLNVSAGGSWMIANRGPRMMTEGEDVTSAVDIFVKDLGIVMDAARASRFPAVVSAAALQVFLGASGAGFGRRDDSQGVRFYEALGARPVRKPGA
ncbi:NAD(P)-dependent oxidoreductase [Rubrimonas cliftonensis]|uniref:3-hydroxyisobutyrate dehydrogenase n=1 Tax=Rubrimonas cliftonensis TaxID=89524 RepID=A0A1H3YML4_9RHOB|nr:NAD(P)-dependent oxidoreductase [Rubrimonas cliftonensis]SEA12268.1 3-hydroxyisobutyrate dehydrogenase [Rubrimonas cliftonensis]